MPVDERSMDSTPATPAWPARSAARPAPKAPAPSLRRPGQDDGAARQRARREQRRAHRRGPPNGGLLRVRQPAPHLPQLLPRARAGGGLGQGAARRAWQSGAAAHGARRHRVLQPRCAAAPGRIRTWKFYCKAKPPAGGLLPAWPLPLHPFGPPDFNNPTPLLTYPHPAAGAYLVDNGRVLILWVGQAAPPAFYKQVFGVQEAPQDASGEGTQVALLVAGPGAGQGVPWPHVGCMRCPAGALALPCAGSACGQTGHSFRGLACSAEPRAGAAGQRAECAHQRRAAPAARNQRALAGARAGRARLRGAHHAF